MDSDLSRSPGIKFGLKKSRLSSTFKRCIKCQRDIKGQKLQTACQDSISKFIEAARLRQDEVSKRIEREVSVINVKWHKSCYASYTSVRNLCRTECGITNEDMPGPLSFPQTRKSHTLTNWLLCVFCQQAKCKWERETSQVLTTQVYDTLMKAAQHRKDEMMLQRIFGEDLIALEAKYHRNCYKKYTSVASCSQTDEMEETLQYNKAFNNVLDEIEDKLFRQQRAFEMATLLELYQAQLIQQGMSEEKACQYKVQNLKKRLVSRYDDQIAFYSQKEKNKSELMSSSSLNIGQLINVVAEVKEAMSCIQTHTGLDVDQSTNSLSQVLYHAAAILTTDMREVKGLTHTL